MLGGLLHVVISAAFRPPHQVPVKASIDCWGGYLDRCAGNIIRRQCTADSRLGLRCTVFVSVSTILFLSTWTVKKRLRSVQWTRVVRFRLTPSVTVCPLSLPRTCLGRPLICASQRRIRNKMGSHDKEWNGAVRTFHPSAASTVR